MISGNDVTTKVFDKLSKAIKFIIMGLMVVVYSYLSISSILQTTTLELVPPTNEHSVYNSDNILLNIALLILLIVFFDVLHSKFLEKINTKVLTLRLCIYTLVFGVAWILSIKALILYDSAMCADTGSMFASGDYSRLQSDVINFKYFSGKFNYFYYYPFQLGYTFVCQLVSTLFKGYAYEFALQLINLLSVVAIFLSLIKISHDIFKSKKVVNLTVILCFGFLPAILFVIFVYGNLLGFAFATWAISLTIRYVQTDKKYLMVVTALLLGISIMVKPNNMIVLLAICIILAIKFLDTKKLYDIVSIVLCAVVGINLINVVIGAYERKANVDLGSGMPKVLWLNIGLNESDRACGWYNPTFSIDVYDSVDGDDELATQVAIQQIKERLNEFTSDPSYAYKFFSEKILSQWNEPTYDTLWLSKTRATGIFNTDVETFLSFTMNQYQQLLYVGSLFGLMLLLKKREPYFYIAPLVILGGFMYHLIFEAKAQYVLTYVMLLIPICAYGLDYFLTHSAILWSIKEKVLKVVPKSE